MIKSYQEIITKGKKILRSEKMKTFFLLYFLMTSGEGLEAVEAYQAEVANEVAITAFQTTTFANSF
jgi:hypothetical protein